MPFITKFFRMKRKKITTITKAKKSYSVVVKPGILKIAYFYEKSQIGRFINLVLIYVQVLDITESKRYSWT